MTQLKMPSIKHVKQMKEEEIQKNQAKNTLQKN
jgi:hypothetical protein